MKEKLLYFSKLTSMAIFSLIKINLLGAFSTVAFAVVGFILLSKDIDAGHSGHVSPLPFIMMTVLAKPFSAVSYYLLLIASPYLFFIFGNKYIISKVINRLIKDNSGTYIEPLLDKILFKVKDKENLLLNENADKNAMKAKLIEVLKNEDENKWNKRAVSYGLKKTNLDDVDFAAPDFSFVDIIKFKVLKTLEDISAPSRNVFWIIIGIQWFIIVLIWLLSF